jgi:hypothetical protein
VCRLVRDKLFINNVEYKPQWGCQEEHNSILVWNVEGLKSKYDDDNFVKFVNKFDLLCFTESWQKPGDTFPIEGYTCVSVFTKKPTGRRGRHSGGVCVYCKNGIFGGVSGISTNSDGVMWIKLDQLFFHTDDDIYICVLYILPAGSAIVNRDDIDFFLETDVARFQGLGKLFICGDLNSRVGENVDILIDNHIGKYIYFCLVMMCLLKLTIFVYLDV